MSFMSKMSAALLAATLTAGTAYAQDPTFFRIGTGGAGGT
ncbi:MAG: C4-dicarboxylate ABC transporter substrate-binding protein, partial [Pseudomonadota bacterium]